MKYYILLLSVSLIFLSCGKKDENNPDKKNSSGSIDEPRYEVNSTGIGPVKEVKLGHLDDTMINEGEQIFNSKCIACHTLDEKRLGPPLGNVTKILRPEFIMNYLLNTKEMQQKEEYFKKLINEYHLVMPDQNLSQPQARAVLEYLRSAAK